MAEYGFPHIETRPRPEVVTLLALLPEPPVPLPPKDLSDSEIIILSEECKICESELFPNTRITLGGCDHLFCEFCLKDYLSVKLSEKNVTRITCPAFNCQCELTDEQLRQLLTDSDLMKLVRFRKEVTLEQNPDMRWCPRVNCAGYDVGGLNRKKLTCNECRFAYCFYCLEAWHPAGKCKADIERKLDRWARSHNAKLCPRCRMRIEKTVGCNHMTCTRCHYEFCWLCGAVWSPTHLDICEVVTFKRKNPPWYVCLGILLLPVILPFFFVIFTVFCIRKYMEENDSGCFYEFLKKWWLSYPILLLLGTILTAFAATAVILFTIAALLIHWGRYVRYDSSSCLQHLARKDCCWAFLSVLLSILLSPFVVLLIALAMAVGPFLGLGLFLFKGAICCVRCCGQRDYMRPKGVVGFPVG